MLFTDEQINQAKTVDLMKLAVELNFELEKSSRGSYHAKKSGGLYIFPDNNIYYSHTGGKGDAIKFVQEYGNMSFIEAVKYLLGQSHLSYIKPQVHVPTQKKELRLPRKDYNNYQVFKYLTKERGIDDEIAKEMFKQNKIYQGTYFSKSSEKWEKVCVFLGFDNENEAKYCSMRGIEKGSEIKYDKTGSSKSYPFVMEGMSNKLFALESPIEVIAHATLTKLNGKNYRKDHRISLGGMAWIPLDKYLKNHPEIDTIVFGLNNDYDKINNRGEYENYGQNKAEKMCKEYSQRYKVLNQIPVNVDFNDDLKCYRKYNCIFREKEMQGANEEENDIEYEEDECLP